VLLELLSLGVTAEALQANIGSKSAISLQQEPVHPKFQVEGVALNQPFFFSATMLNDISYRIKNLGKNKIFLPFLSQFTCLTDRQTDRQTDGQTEFSSLDSVVKTESLYLLLNPNSF